MKRALLIGVLVLVSFSFASAAGISFGSVGHNQRFTMIPGETRDIKMSFFNYGNDPLIVRVDQGGSDEIVSSITPGYFILESKNSVTNPAGEEEWVVLGNSYVKAVPVHVVLKVKDRTELTKNYHVVKIVATASTEEETSGGLSEKVNSVREYSYSITIPGNIKAPTEEEYEQTVEQFYQELDNNGKSVGNGTEEGGQGSWNIKSSGSSESVSGSTQNRQLPTGFFSLGSGEEESTSYIIPVLIILILAFIAYKRLRR